jgi:hypothetical protein
VQIERHPEADPAHLARGKAIPVEKVPAALQELRDRGLIRNAASDGKRDTLTSAGCDVLDRLASARRAHLSELAEEWDPERGTDVSEFLRDAVRDLIPDARRAS